MQARDRDPAAAVDKGGGVIKAAALGQADIASVRNVVKRYPIRGA